jgi:dihydrofolate reductase
MLRSSDVSCSCQATGNMVASTTLTEPLEWQNSTLLQGDLAEAVLALKQEDGGDLHVIGSSELGTVVARPRPGG